MYCMSVLVNCTSFDKVEKSLQNIHQLFGSPYVDDDVNTAHEYLCKMISSLRCAEETDFSDNLELNAEEDTDEDTIDKGDEEDVIKSQSRKPFGTYFEQRLKKKAITETKISKNNLLNIFHK